MSPGHITWLGDICFAAFMSMLEADRRISVATQRYSGAPPVHRRISVVIQRYSGAPPVHRRISVVIQRYSVASPVHRRISVATQHYSGTPPVHRRISVATQRYSGTPPVHRRISVATNKTDSPHNGKSHPHDKRGWLFSILRIIARPSPRGDERRARTWRATK